ncbi:nucleotide exchange factor GrpE [Clostridium sp. OS1-26]|uniref:nucleotide exchange factor GrpE n=1 Tax=Clostridium sp. OS1-26 TaxID=3070681 RepID=UPI0027E09AC3|nr:nucleotide exchange factor GrpE [Clostridium sp. OS1-26]WML37709.1 nucleotide exchange factor GrpE [Clostridium sp. OS1-26]
MNEEDKKIEENECIDSLEKEENLQEVDNAEEVNSEKVEDVETNFDDLLSGVKEENQKLLDENNKIENENEALKDRLARLNAEYDNFRKRTSKEKEGIYTDACEDVLKEMLPVLDNLERAISVEGSAEDIKKGIEITIKQFGSALEKLSVEEISNEGEFDPNFHNAVMHIEDDQYGKNQVVEVFQKGYKRGDKVLRYSMVKVAN